MKYTLLTLFPEISDAFFAVSVMAKAIDRGIVEYCPINIRDFAPDKHHSCDDAPYGGGAGMLMMAEPLGLALQAAGVIPGNGTEPAGGPAAFTDKSRRRVICLSPSGRLFTQKLAEEFAGLEELVLVCGRYEGIDQRIIDLYIDEEISVGDYVLSSGETAALVVIDATYRLVDRVIRAESLEEESFSGGLLEYPQYTRPEIYATIQVPELLLSGHHEHIRRWRLEKRVEKTLKMRPDLIRKGLAAGIFDDETLKLISALQSEEEK
ncbi:MAG: tRNA (guanosine(37)-N1)-methyltransferase TrmD [Treponema sp.]|nr:tRNA (guanosine(37)-N1)-methyltransferase TrmD [Treponema sp.]